MSEQDNDPEPIPSLDWRSPWAVTLRQRVDGATPKLAVKAFIDNISQFGLATWTFTVIDSRTEEVFYVEPLTNQVWTEAEYQLHLQQQEEQVGDAPVG